MQEQQWQQLQPAYCAADMRLQGDHQCLPAQGARVTMRLVLQAPLNVLQMHKYCKLEALSGSAYLRRVPKS
jgi:hypothetical protein